MVVRVTEPNHGSDWLFAPSFSNSEKVGEADVKAEKDDLIEKLYRDARCSLIMDGVNELLSISGSYELDNIL